MPNLYDGQGYRDPKIMVAPTIALLRAIQGPTPLPTTALQGTGVVQSYPLAILLGGGAAFDGTDGLYAWDEVSVTADNGTSVIKPTAVGAGNPGRWRQIL